MKILWIEDFGDRLSRSEIIENVFSEFFTEIDLGHEYRENDTDTGGQLSSLFGKHTLHEICVCESYLEWKSVYAQHEGDFDIVLIDINLVSSITPDNQKPSGIKKLDFDTHAGFYIYHQLIRGGFPDNNIAFFTAQGQSLKQFSEYCGDMFLDKPANCFQKKSADFQRLRRWLSEKARDRFLILRRGIIDGCRSIKEQIASIESSELETQLIIYKTMPGSGDDSEALRRDSLDYLTSLERRFLSHQFGSESEFYWFFVKELSAKWEETKWSYMRHKAAPQFGEWLEEQFQRTAHFQMKMLRNWSSHRLLSLDITSKEVAYFFMLAMRTLIQSDLNEVFRYEQILSTLFDSVSGLALDRSMRSILPLQLERSYEELRALHKELLRLVRDYSSTTRAPHNLNRRSDNYFLGIFRESGEFLNFLEKEGRSERGERIKLVDPGIIAFHRRQLREASVKMFYHSFWHGIFPLQIKSICYADLQTIKFYIEPLPNSFLSFLGRTIFTECFREEVSVSVA